MTAVDSSVILDFLCGAEATALRAEKALRNVLAEGNLVICECVLAEICPTLAPSELEEFLADWSFLYRPCSKEAAILAGQHFKLYLERKGAKRRMLADFLIGAHAQLQCDRLLARDRGYWRDYFDSLEVLEP